MCLCNEHHHQTRDDETQECVLILRDISVCKTCNKRKKVNLYECIVRTRCYVKFYYSFTKLSMQPHKVIHGYAQRGHRPASNTRRLRSGPSSHGPSGKTPRIRAIINIVPRSRLLDDALAPGVERAKRGDSFRVRPGLRCRTSRGCFQRFCYGDFLLRHRVIRRFKRAEKDAHCNA